MAKQKPTEVITPPNMLKVKAGGALPKIDQDAIARAEAALKNLSGQFDEWMADELEKLEAVWSEGKAAGDPCSEGLYRRAHDIKGLAATYEYPLVTRLAASLCRLIETEELRKAAPAALVEGLVNGIRIAVRDDIRTDEHPVGRALAIESETAVAKLIDAHKNCAA
ncbi:MAG: Hpt domain-containing protein [Maricaulaceae bacterium]